MHEEGYTTEQVKEVTKMSLNIDGIGGKVNSSLHGLSYDSAKRIWIALL
jgi:hypothetical protein